ncbi:hypothetical protein DTO027B5_5659 [Paecilomyces variotii]|nr:hypothetical protein DTO021C3_5393 [Paecilomyces variotii]KAJ9306695.1 hypothetical protein DTO217A2_3863 [Paecilomyces variotii]KAJ9325528.1 hypothetical protein DTO027B3_3464 [Paecilomyces variotii]KAJ9332526.1 hypothetical protein DTO027B5_5659 [Paecilomyces variotii]KAJ9371794.1 hypothetical protein DTO282E5_3415 [Paecilomyces variotii]
MTTTPLSSANDNNHNDQAHDHVLPSSLSDSPEQLTQRERKLANLRSSIAKLESQISETESQLAEARSRLKDKDDSRTVQRHIRLLHSYNEIKDVGQGLMGLIADARGVRHVDVQREFGIGEKD